jgi:sarcosine/dimethylglycine N-methyltransferase
MEKVDIADLTSQLTNHYGRVREELTARRESLKGHVSEDYVERMLAGLQHWVDAGRAHKLAWGILHFRKPG